MPNNTRGHTTPTNHHSFLIRNHRTSTCLTNAHYRDPFTYDYYHQHLYEVVLVPCNTSSPTPRWEWTNRGALLHTATLLCLSMNRIDQKHLVVLETCKTSVLDDQKWRCDGNVIKQPDTLTCMIAPSGSSKRSSVVAQRKVRSTPQTSQTDPHTHQPMQELAGELEEILGELNEMKGLDNQNMTLVRIPKETMERISVGGSNGIATSAENSHHVIFGSCNDDDDEQKWSILDYQSDENLPDGSSLCTARDARQFVFHRCYAENMKFIAELTAWTDGWVSCTRPGSYINGFSHTFNARSENLPDSGLISGLRCCAGDHTSTDVNQIDEACFESEWWERPNDSILSGGWFTCPDGYFFKGFLLTAKEYFPNENVIKRAKCCRPTTAPDRYVAPRPSDFTFDPSDLSSNSTHLFQWPSYIPSFRLS